MKYQVLNKDKDKLESGKKVVCPRCHGYGALFPDDKYTNNCTLCNGYCFVVKSKTSGWIKPLYRRLHESKLY